MVDSLICICTHDKSEHNTPTRGCGAEQCRCTFFRDEAKIPKIGSATKSIEAIEKVEIDESKLIERFKECIKSISEEDIILDFEKNGNKDTSISKSV